MSGPPEKPPSPDDQKRTLAFIAVFSEVEQLLKKRLSRKGNVGDLIQRYAETNPYWSKDHLDLDHLRRIRNLLIHEQSERHGFPVVVTVRSHARLVEIKEGLETSVPISKRYKKAVTTVGLDASLAQVLKLAYEKEFSQFPVVDDGGGFRGLVTENEIIRWLGRQIGKKGTMVDLAKVPAWSVLREKETDRRLIPIFRFESLEKPETEVMGLFMRYPMLEVVLLTASGTKATPIEGIITQWDAARYPSG
jgi:CBS domain-containing protein